jgi:cytochrome c oxidase subunit III
MAALPPTVVIDEPRTNLGDSGGAPPPAKGGGGDDSRDFSSLPFAARLRRARLGMAVAVSGIVMIFISFASAYLVRQGLPTLDVRTGTLIHDWIWLQLPNLVLINTAVLLISSLAMELARRQATRELAEAEISVKHQGQISWLALTVALGLSFLAGQLIVWRELAASGFYLGTSPSSSFVYLLTGMHGIHLLGGVLALLVAGAASLLRRPVSSRLVVLDVTGWYWHFMAFLWVCILCLLEFAR